MSLNELKSISNSAASAAYTKFINTRSSAVIPDSHLRRQLYGPLNESVLKIQGGAKPYLADIDAGLKIHTILDEKEIGLTVAADPGFWRYLSIEVLPDVVFRRWGDSPDHYWQKNRRIWFRSLWWYVHLSWQGSEESTRKILESLTTDEILNLVERSGRSGYRINLYREIMRQLPRYREMNTRTDLFRRVMKLNTARILSIEPALSKGGIEGYVTRLYEYFSKR